MTITNAAPAAPSSPITLTPSGASGTTYTLPGVSWVSLDIQGSDGTLTVGSTSVGVHVTPPADGAPARVEADLSQITLAALSATAVAAGSPDPLSALPQGLSAALSDVAISHVGLSIDLSARRLIGIDLTVAAGSPWALLPGHVELDELQVTVSVTRAGDSTMFEVTGQATLAGTQVTLTVTHDEASTYAVSLAAEGDQRLGLATIASFVGDDLQAHLPAQLSGLTGAGLAEATVVLTADGVESLEVTLSTGAPIPLPDPVGLTVEQVSVQVAVEHPTDAASRAVSATIEGRATFAGAAVVVRIERDRAEHGAEAWRLHAGLAEGATLTASGVGTAYGLSMPADLPDLALTACAFDAVLDGSSMTFTAASPTEWTVPVGADGLGLGRLGVNFARHARDAQGRTVSGSITGVVHLAGIDVPVTYAVPGGLTLHALIPEVAPFRLLQDVCGAVAVSSLSLPPELLALAMSDVELSIDVERRELSFAARGPGFRRVQAVARKSTTWGFAVGIELDDSYRFSSLSPALGGLDTVHLPDALIVISSFDDTTFTFEQLQPVAGTGVSRGLAVDGQLDLSGLGADKFLGKAHLDVQAQVGTSLRDLRLEAGLGDVTITRGVVIKDAEFALAPDPENVSVTVSGAVDVTVDSSALEFIGGVKVVPNGISFFATMKGRWQDPFGAKGIALSNVSLEIGSDFEGVPSIGIAGGLVIGAFEGKAAVSFNSELPTQSVLIVAFNHLSLLDVVDTFCPPTVTAEIPTEVSATLAGISLEDVDLYVVPQDTTIGALRYEQGLRVGGKLHVAGFTAQADVEIDPQDGIAASGSLSPVSIGSVFSLTGADPTKGPDLDIQVKASAVPKVEFSRRANLLGLAASASVALSDKGFDFECSGRVFGLFDADLTAKGGSLQSGAGFMIHADLRQGFLDDVARRAAAVLQQAAADAQAQIASAQHAVDDAQADVKRFGASVEASKRDLAAKQADAQSQIQGLSDKVVQAQHSLGVIDAQIAATRTQIQSERDAAAAQLRDLRQKLAAAQAPVDSLTGQIAAQQAQIDQLNRDIAWWNRWYNNLKWYDKTWGWTRLGAEVGWRGTQLAALNLSIQGLRGSLIGANALLQGAQQAMNHAQGAAATYPIEQDPRILGLQGPREGARLALQGAQGALDAARQSTAIGIALASQTLTGFQQQLGLAQSTLASTTAELGHLGQTIGDVAAVATYVAAHGLGALLEVRSAAFTGTLEASSGGSVTLDADVVFQGVASTVHLSYDFHNLAAGAKALAKQVLPSLPV